MEQQVPINTARYPGRYSEFDNLMDAREEGVRILYDNVDKFGMINKDYGWNAEELEDLVKELRMQLAASGSGRDLCIFIDNFHDLSSEKISIGTDQNARFEQAGGALKNISETYDVPIIATAEYKKLEGKSRPVISDIKQTGKTIYQAKTVMLCYNEVGVKDEMAKVFFGREERERKSPIFEVHIAKNKSSDMKSRLFYEFYEEMARFEEVPSHRSGYYLNMLGG
jgi:replicative DNA helicase